MPETASVPVTRQLNVEDLPWANWILVHVKLLRVSEDGGSYTLLTKMPPGTRLPKHRHMGPVSGYTLQGRWRYLEYDWVGKPSDFIRESPGRTHTLYAEHGMKTFFWLNGPLEFLDDEDRVMETVDVFWFIDHYEDYCAEHGITIDKRLYL
jgi:quercetin dioxygenase-like cupin family protein